MLILIMAKYKLYFNVWLLILLTLTDIQCFDDEFYTCSGWGKRCLSRSNKLGEFNVISGDLFNCYFGFTPICTQTVKADTKNKTDFCQSLNSESNFNKFLGSCAVLAQLVGSEEVESHYRQLFRVEL